MVRQLTDHSVLTFDCYGTLIDWETGIWEALQPLLGDNQRGDVTREEALEAFNLHEADQQAATPALSYPGVLERVHRSLAGHLGMPTTGSLDEALQALDADHEFLLRGDVFSEDLIRTWIDWKMENEVIPCRIRPTPWEFALYYDI